MNLKARAFAALLVATLLFTAAQRALAAMPLKQADISQLPLTFPTQSPQVVEYFDQVARPEDIASFPAQFAHLLPQVGAGKKMVGYASWEQAEGELASLGDEIDLVMYNPEHWENTPPAEQQNLEATVQKAAAWAHARSWQFVFVPDRLFAEQSLGNVAAYVDVVILQGQRLQADPQAFDAWMSNMIGVARAANPDLKIYAQVGATRGTAQEMLAAIQTVSGDIDGIAIWSTPNSLAVLQEFVSMVRAPAPAQATAAPSATNTTVPTETSEPATEKPTAVMTGVDTVPAATALPTRAEPTASPSLTALTSSATSSATTTTTLSAGIGRETPMPTVRATWTAAERVAGGSAEPVAWWSYLAIGGVALVIAVLLSWMLRRRRSGEDL